MTNTIELNQAETDVLKALMAKAHLQAKQSDDPVVFSLDENEDLVLLQASRYQKLLDYIEEIEEAETVAAIDEGMADIEAGRVRPAKEFFAELRKEFGFSEPSDDLK